MARVQSPTLFSTYFNLNPTALDTAGLIDPFIDVDTQLFIDPVLLEKSSIPTVAVDGVATFRKHFGNFVRLLAISVRVSARDDQDDVQGEEREQQAS